MKTLLRRIVHKLASEITSGRYELFHKLNERAMESSADFILANSTPHTNYHSNHWDLRKEAFAKIPASGLILEFGVNKGTSANFFSNLLTANNDERTYWGFDSFEGLSEDWGGTPRRQGTFNRNGKPPELNSNIKCVTGDILETLGPFLEEHKDPIAFIHIDTDTYAPCYHILQSCKHRLQIGSVILFDELLGYPNYQSHELKALDESLPGSSYEFVSFGIAHARAKLIKAAIIITGTVTDDETRA